MIIKFVQRLLSKTPVCLLLTSNVVSYEISKITPLWPHILSKTSTLCSSFALLHGFHNTIWLNTVPAHSTKLSHTLSLKFKQKVWQLGFITASHNFNNTILLLVVIDHSPFVSYKMGWIENAFLNTVNFFQNLISAPIVENNRIVCKRNCQIHLIKAIKKETYINHLVLYQNS